MVMMKKGEVFVKIKSKRNERKVREEKSRSR